MDVGKKVPNHYKLSCLHSLFPNSFKLYAIVLILFIIYFHIIVSYFCTPLPSKVITIVWINLKFLTDSIREKRLHKKEKVSQNLLRSSRNHRKTTHVFFAFR